MSRGSRALERKVPLTELADRWGWSTSKIYRLVAHRDPAKRLPHVRIGGGIYFEESALEAWLAARRREEGARQVPRATPSRAEECAALGIPTEHRFSS